MTKLLCSLLILFAFTSLTLHAEDKATKEPKQAKKIKNPKKKKCTHYLREEISTPGFEAAIDQHRYLFPDLPLMPYDLQRQAIILTEFDPEAINVLIALMKGTYSKDGHQIKPPLKKDEFLDLIGYHLPISLAGGVFLPQAFKLSGEDPDLFFQMVIEDDFEI